MRKFRVTVTRYDDYIIEIDDNEINEEFMDLFSKYFFDCHSLQDHAENIAQYYARFETRFIEGYGDVFVNGKRSWTDKTDLQYPINIIPKGSYVETESFEIKD